MMFGSDSYIFIIFILISINFNFKPITALSPEKFSPPKRLEGNDDIETDYFESQTNVNPVNLRIGMPNFKPPIHIQGAMTNTVLGDYTFSQYTGRDGLPRFVNAVAQLYSKLLNITLDPNNNVNVGFGATQMLFATIHAHTSPGDEWIVIEPYFVSYVRVIKSAYGVPRLVALKTNKTYGGNSSKDWSFDREEMEKAFNDKTKGIILNNPHNPTGKVFTYEELEFIANLTKKWDVLVVCDEVYEFMVYDNNKHIRMATLPDMFERTVTISSVSKTFSSTGYRLGWAYGGEQVMKNLKFIQQQMIQCASTPAQEAFARVLEKELRDFGKPNSYLNTFNKKSQEKRNYLIKIFRNLGMSVIVPEAGYFFVANTTSLGNINYDGETGSKDVKFAKWLLKNVEITGYALSNFYITEHRHLAEEGIRFTFIKTDSTLKEAEKRIQKYLSNSQHNDLE